MLRIFCSGHKKRAVTITTHNPLSNDSEKTGSGPYLNPLLTDGKLIKVEDCILNDVDGRQDGQTNVDGITSLGVQNQNLRLLDLWSFLHKIKRSETRGQTNKTNVASMLRHRHKQNLLQMILSV